MTQEQSELEIRVNGIEVSKLRLQLRWVEGYPARNWAVLVEIPNLGYIELDEKPDFKIEVKDPRVPYDQRSWRQVTLPELLQWLSSLGILDPGEV